MSKKIFPVTIFCGLLVVTGAIALSSNTQAPSESNRLEDWVGTWSTAQELALTLLGRPPVCAARLNFSERDTEPDGSAQHSAAKAARSI